MVTERRNFNSFPMERKALAVRAMVKKHCPKKEDLDPRKWMTRDKVKGFADLLHHNSDKDTDKSFDNNEMCE